MNILNNAYLSDMAGRPVTGLTFGNPGCNALSHEINQTPVTSVSDVRVHVVWIRVCAKGCRCVNMAHAGGLILLALENGTGSGC